jgi:hypothetical protein
MYSVHVTFRAVEETNQSTHPMYPVSLRQGRSLHPLLHPSDALSLVPARRPLHVGAEQAVTLSEGTVEVGPLQVEGDVVQAAKGGKGSPVEVRPVISSNECGTLSTGCPCSSRSLWQNRTLITEEVGTLVHRYWDWVGAKVADPVIARDAVDSHKKGMGLGERPSYPRRGDNIGCAGSAHLPILPCNEFNCRNHE